MSRTGAQWIRLEGENASLKSKVTDLEATKQEQNKHLDSKRDLIKTLFTQLEQQDESY
jgi:hypothetical protein